MTATHSFVTFQVDGVHCWPGAPRHLSYLRAPHRHQFHFKVTFPQEADRGIEFHEYKTYVLQTLRVSYGRTGPSAALFDFQDKSCEAIASALAKALVLSSSFKVAWIAVTVSEDGEFGSTVNVAKAELLVL